MEQISFFLEKFKTLGLESTRAKEVFIEQAAKILSARISPQDIKIKDGILYVKACPALKSELYLKRKIFIGELSRTLGSVKITGLR